MDPLGDPNPVIPLTADEPIDVTADSLDDSQEWQSESLHAPKKPKPIIPEPVIQPTPEPVPITPSAATPPPLLVQTPPPPPAPPQTPLPSWSDPLPMTQPSATPPLQIPVQSFPEAAQPLPATAPTPVNQASQISALSLPIQAPAANFEPLPQDADGMSRYATDQARPGWQRELLASLPSHSPITLDKTEEEPVQASVPVNAYRQPYSSLPRNDFSAARAPTPIQPASLPVTYEQAGSSYDLAQAQTSSHKGALFYIGITLLSLLVLGGSGFASYSFGNKAGYRQGVSYTKEQLKDQLNQQNQSNQQSGQTELSFELVDPIYKDETITGTVAQKLESSDGFVVYVKDVETDFKVQGVAQAGQQFVKVNFLVGNASKSVPIKVTNANFNLLTSAGETIDYDSTASGYDGMIDSLTLRSGSQAQMSVVFQIKKESTPQQLIREQTYKAQNSDRTVKSITKVSLNGTS